jgi:hypothetical protein
MAKRVVLVLSALVVLTWVAVVGYTVVSAIRMQPGWSFLPVNVVVESVVALIALAVIWGTFFGVRETVALWRESRRGVPDPFDSGR